MAEKTTDALIADLKRLDEALDTAIEADEYGAAESLQGSIASHAKSIISALSAGQAAERTRDAQQADIAAWAARTFGADEASSIPQRGVRLLEEAAEAYQSCAGSREMAHKLIDYVFDRPVGELEQELGGVAITLLCLAEAAGFSARECERNEIERIKSKPLAHFAARNKAKNDAGFLTLSRVPDEEGR